MLTPPRQGVPFRSTRAGFTVMEVALAASIMVVVVGAVTLAFTQFMRNQSVRAHHDLLHRSAMTIQETLQLDLLNLSRRHTFSDSGQYQHRSSASVGLRLRDPRDSSVYAVTYAWDLAAGTLTRTQASGPSPGTRTFAYLGSIHFSNLTNDHVVVEGTVDEARLHPDGLTGQQIAFRASAAVRMR